MFIRAPFADRDAESVCISKWIDEDTNPQIKYGFNPVKNESECQLGAENKGCQNNCPIQRIGGEFFIGFFLCVWRSGRVWGRSVLLEREE